jgi:hypothetical protein
MSFVLIAISLLLSRYAAYHCRYRSDGSYIFFVLLSFVPMFRVVSPVVV